MYTIQLHNLHFHAPVGVYEEEKQLGTSLLIDLTLFIKEGESSQHSGAEDFVDYEKVYKLISKTMSAPCDLLETLARDIIANLFESYRQISQIDISITKKHPPIHAFKGSVSVTFSKLRDR